MLKHSNWFMSVLLLSASISLSASAATPDTKASKPNATPTTVAPAAAPGAPPATTAVPAPIKPPVATQAKPAPAGQPTQSSATKAGTGSPGTVASVASKTPATQPVEPAKGTPFVNSHFVLTGALKVNGYHENDPTLVIVDKGSHSTYVLQLQNNHVTRVLTISNAIGSEEKPTPPGRYFVLSKKQFPTWIPPKTIDKKQKPVPPYNETHKNPLGVAAIFLNKDELALHGTNDPKEIRQSASHGCIRHSNSDISKLYGMVHKGDVVMIIRQFRGTVLNKSDFKPRHVKTSKAG